MDPKLEATRREIGTLPREHVTTETKFYHGVEGIWVDLVDGPINPYKAIVTMVTATWGNVWSTYRWGEMTPEARLHVVLSTLFRKTLPNALESFSMTFEVAGVSRSAFDQIARARIGAVFSSMGWRDNCHTDIGFRVPQSIADDPDKLAAFKAGRLHDKSNYLSMLDDRGSWQDARSVLPISALHRFVCSFSFMALQNFMAKRLMFNEQADTVATAWLMRNEVKIRYPLLAKFLRPASDWAKRCLEHEGDEFGNLFRCSGRWPCDQADPERFTFNYSCSSKAAIEKQCGIYIPEGHEDRPTLDITLDQLVPSDLKLFQEP